jgi:hypothetical protein
VVVTVTSVNDPPVAGADTAQTNEDTPLTLTSAALIANDTDRDGDPLTMTAVAVTANTHGAVALASGVVTYSPAGDFNGSADFTYTVSDGNGGTATGLVTVTVVPVNDAPVAVGDTLTTAEDAPVAVAASVLAGNDTDVDGDALTVTAVATTATTHGSVDLTAGTVSYTPTANYNGPADFRYTVSDGQGGTATGSVQVTVTPVNDAPVVITSAGTVNYVENAALLAIDPGITVTDLDSATLAGATVQITGGCTSGEDVLAIPPPPNDLAAPLQAITTTYDAATCTLTLTGVASVASYQAALRSVAYANSSDTPATIARVVRFTVDDGQAANNTGSASRNLSVTAVDDAPVAVADSATVVEDSGATAIPVLDNDTDVDGGPKAIGSITQPARGTVVITGGGTGLTYAPNADYCNLVVAPGLPGAALRDTFTYTLAPGTSRATVTMTVTCVDDPPVAVNGAATVVEGSADNPVDVLADATDIDGGPRTVASITQPGHGTAVIGLAGLSITYTPAAGYCNQAPNEAPDTFTYTLAPGASSATVSMTVTCACGKTRSTDFVVGSN